MEGLGVSGLGIFGFKVAFLFPTTATTAESGFGFGFPLCFLLAVFCCADLLFQISALAT